jgi:hypothetical protein
VKFDVGGRRSCSTQDDHSPIQHVEFSLDGQRWRACPQDGVADSKDEHYELVIGGEIGERGVIIRASTHEQRRDGPRSARAT